MTDKNDTIFLKSSDQSSTQPLNSRVNASQSVGHDGSSRPFLDTPPAVDGASDAGDVEMQDFDSEYLDSNYENEDEEDEGSENESLDVDKLMSSAEADLHFHPHLSQLHPVMRSVLRDAVIQRTQDDLNDITKVCHYEFVRNPLSTQFVLTKEFVKIFKNYGEHGSQVRLEKGITQFLQAGDTVVRPVTERKKDKYHKAGSAELKLIEIESRLPRYEKAKLRFSAVPALHVKEEEYFDKQANTSQCNDPYGSTYSSAATAPVPEEFTSCTPRVDRLRPQPFHLEQSKHLTPTINGYRSDSAFNVVEQGHMGYVPGISAQEMNVSDQAKPYLKQTISQNTSGRLFQANVVNDSDYCFDNTEESMARYDPKVNKTMRLPPRRHETLEVANQAQHVQNVTEQTEPARIPTIKQLLPAQQNLDHTHPSTLTTDPETHERLDPDHLHYIAFEPVDTDFTIQRGALLPPGAAKVINNIFELENISAKQLFLHLCLKYAPRATLSQPQPPAPPFALFRAAITSYYRSQLSTIITAVQNDPLGLSPNIRSLLKDLYENRECAYGRAGPSSLANYHNLPDSLRHDNWRLGHEGVTNGGLNDVECEVLMRATRVLDEACDMWWQDRTRERHQWTMLKVWCRGKQLERLKDARRNGWF